MLLKNFTLDIRCDGRQLVSVEVLKVQATLAALSVRPAPRAGVGLALASPAIVALAASVEADQARRTYMVQCFDLDADAVESHAKEHGHDATYALMCSGEHAAFKGST